MSSIAHEVLTIIFRRRPALLLLVDVHTALETFEGKFTLFACVSISHRGSGKSALPPLHGHYKRQQHAVFTWELCRPPRSFACFHDGCCGCPPHHQMQNLLGANENGADLFLRQPLQPPNWWSSGKTDSVVFWSCRDLRYNR